MRGAMGVTRVGDITGLDRIGIPVVQVTRPLSLSNAVSLGKGGDMAQAAISALLECAETFFAERIERFDAVSARAAALDIPAERFRQHLRVPGDVRWRELESAWVVATDMMGGGDAWVPLELVHTAYVVPPDPHDGLFWPTTIGLAASFHEADAALHGLLECIERDALARAHGTHGFLHRWRIDAATIDDEAVLALLDHLAGKGILTGLWLAPSPTGLPVVLCHLMEEDARETAYLHLPADGSAAAFDPAAAILAAIREAAQARLAAISGARDDITRAYYRRFPDWQLIEAHRRLLVEGPREIGFPDIAREWPATLAGALGSLERAGMDAAYLVRIDTGPVDGFSVVRAIVPQLRPLLEA